VPSAAALCWAMRVPSGSTSAAGPGADRAQIGHLVERLGAPRHDPAAHLAGAHGGLAVA